jgi:glycosyltransferase involved in cell wall biosynthesis
MPTYNRSNSIEKRIQMILNQTYTNWVLLIIDDGSLIEHKKQIDILKNKYSTNNKILFLENEENLYISKTLNKGIQYLIDDNTFTHFTWISDDNNYYPNFLHYLQYNNEWFSYSYYHIHEVNNTRSLNTRAYINLQDLLSNFNGCASFMWTRDAILQIGFYNEFLWGCEDYEYLLRTFELNANKCTHRQRSLMMYIRHDGSQMEQNRNEIIKLKNQIIQKYVLNDA